MDIGNVGGQAGVASEATLIRLTASIEAMAAKAGLDPKAEAAKLQKLYAKELKTTIPITRAGGEASKEDTKEKKKATKQTVAFTKAIKGAALGAIGAFGTSVSNFAKELMGSSTELSSFTQHIPVFGNSLTFLAGIIDTNLAVFRDLSQVGATFGSGMNDIRRIAAEASIPLGDFVSLVGQSSEQMKLFGATTGDGAKNFAAMSIKFRQGPGKELMNLGFTSMELNELLIDYAEFQDSQLGKDRRNTKVNTAAAAAFGENLMALSAVTGKQRSEILKSMQANQEETRVRAAMAGMADGGELFLQNLSAAPAAFQDVLKDMADGIPHSEAAAGMMSMSEEFRKNAKNIKNMDANEMNNFMARVNEDLERQIERFGAGAVESIVRGGGAVGEAIGNIAPGLKNYSVMSKEQFDKYKKEVAQEKKEQNPLKTFGETINDLRSKLVLAFIKSGVLKAFQDFASDKLANLGTFLQSQEFKDGLQLFTDSLKEGMTVVTKFFDDWKKYDLKTALFGGTKKGADGKDVEVKGIFSGIGGIPIVDIISGGISSALSGLFDSFEIPWDKVFVGGMAALGIAIAAPVLGIPGMLLAAVVAVIGLEGLKKVWTATWDTITGFFSFGTGEDAASYSIGNLAKGAWTTVTGWFGFGEGEATYAISTLASAAWTTVTGWFTLGADGNYSIADIASKVWTSVTGWFTLADTKFSISEDLTKLWNTVTGWFGFGEGQALLSIKTLVADAWETVKGFFGFGSGDSSVSFSITDLISEAWKTIKGFFSFGSGEDAVSFSISGLLTTAWETITSFFSFEGIEIPSVGSMLQSVIDTVKGFFTFDFKMPSFKSFLPKWLGGEGKTIDSAEAGGPQVQQAPPNIPDPKNAGKKIANLESAQDVVKQLVDLPNLKAIFAEVNRSLNTGKVRSYATALEDVAEQMRQINELATKREGNGLFKAATYEDTAGGSALKSGGLGGNAALNTSMEAMLVKLDSIITNTGKAAKNTGGISNDISTNLSVQSG